MSRRNGEWPSTAAYSVTPSDHRSDAGPGGRPSAFPGQEFGRTHQLPGGRERGGSLDHGDAEVAEDDPPVVAEQNVGRFHIPVQHADGVRRPQRREHLGADPRGPRRRHRPLGVQDLRERQTGHQLHDDPRPSVRHDHVVHRDDVAVRDPGRRAPLALQPLVQPAHLVRREPGGRADLLDGHRAAQHLVAGPPHDAHPATPELVLQPVTARQHAPVGVPGVPGHRASLPRESNWG
ncbi:hypothetical protein GCM10020221_00760 [Streptomyces thioluteus]|uniref:Uncharacterized protein n=1 Tax=Streptomyces thioluteus TaxID=66431 RepID=A0ABN3WAL4_STRTU